MLFGDGVFCTYTLAPSPELKPVKSGGLEPKYKLPLRVITTSLPTSSTVSSRLLAGRGLVEGVGVTVAVGVTVGVTVAVGVTVEVGVGVVVTVGVTVAVTVVVGVGVGGTPVTLKDTIVLPNVAV